MRVTESIARVIYFTSDNTCGLSDVGEHGMSSEDRENVRILEFPKTIRHDGKSYRVTRIWFSNYAGFFPKLKKVKVPKDLEYEVRDLNSDGIELILY